MNALAKLDKATQMLAEAKNLEEVKYIVDIAEAARTYARAARLGLDAQNHAAEICLMAKRKAGEFLAQLEKGQGKNNQYSETFTRESFTSPFAEAVDAAGITPVEASRYQLMASLPEEKFVEVVAEAKQSGKELTSSMVMKAARAEKNAAKPAPKVPDGKYRVIYADPPWKYTSGDQHSHEEQDTTLGTHYGSMSIPELCELPIKHLAQDDAVLFMWTTSPLLEECFDVIRAWGFEYKASIVWDKDAHNVGNYVSVRHEFLLICTRGSCKPDSGKLLPSVVREKRTEHSVKPETFRQMIDSMYTDGKRIELFARRPADGWDVWGNDV